MKPEYDTPSGRKKPTIYSCPHNEACRCKVKNCYSCGWNPKVQQIREQRLNIKRKTEQSGENGLEVREM